MDFIIFFFYTSGCIFWILIAIYCTRAIALKIMMYIDSKRTPPELKWFGAMPGDEVKTDQGTYRWVPDNDNEENGGSVIMPEGE